MESSDLVRALDKLAIDASVSAGSLLFRRGDHVSGVFIVRSGKVALICAGRSDNVFPLETVGPGGLIGLPAAFNGDYSVTARAVEDCEVGYIPADRVLHALDGDTVLMQSALKFLAQELARMRSLYARSSDS